MFPAQNGCNNLLAAIDLATSELRLFATKGRSSATTASCILHGLVMRNGCPLRIQSDHAKEFIGKACNRLAELLGYNISTTLGHHPTGNAAVERVWQYTCLLYTSPSPRDRG